MHLVAGAVLIFGLGAFIAQLFATDLAAFAWMDQWGVEVGWGIRAAVVILGAVLWLVSQRAGDEPLMAKSSNDEPPPPAG
ncbi:MAG: hypothetical protein AAFQ42_10640 [Pseudomonadota bacterium]